MVSTLFLALVVFLIPEIAHAHAELVTPYIFPMPLEIYLLGCAATLIATFAIMAVIPVPPGSRPVSRALPRWPLHGPIARGVLGILRAGAVACLGLVVIAGLIGIQHPLANINQTLFWLVFVLCFAYLTALIGNLFELINPWKVLVVGAEALGLDFAKPRIAYPERLGYYPAFLSYIALIWIELYVLPRPSTLSLALILYALITFAGAWLFGKAAWFEQGELFSVYFRVIGTLAPVGYARAADGWQLQLRRPFSALLETRAEHVSLLLFVLFMLSSTTYDGIHETDFWLGLYWKSALALTQPLWGADLGKAQTMLLPGYLAYQRAGLVLSPFLYLGIYLLALWAMRALARTTLALRTLALQFTCSIIPIAFVYSLTHNLTHLLVQLPSLPYLATNPFGFGWNLFGVNMNPPLPAPVEMGPVWHSQVALMLGGHMVSVYVAHVMALRVLPDRRQAAVSQLPLLALMVAYTVIGLWVLTLPIQAVPD
jgi:hypothetical protein